MASNSLRSSYRFPRAGYGFRGEHSREGVTDEIYQAGFLYRARDYHFIGRGRARKRQGHQPFGGTMAAGKAIQSLKMYQWSGTRKLYGVCDGDLYRYDESTELWTGVTGSVSIPSGQNEYAEFAHFRDGSGAHLVGVSGGRPWSVLPAGNAAYVTSGADVGPTAGVDVVEFMGRLWVIESTGKLSYSDDGVMATWINNGGSMYCTRESPGTALVKHGQKAMIVFHHNSTHSIQFNYTGGLSNWIVQTIDGDIGCDYAPSAIHFKGITYFKGPDGFYRISSPNKAAEYIGGPMEDVWSGLNFGRLKYMRAFARGEPWNEIVWCASGRSSSEHNTFFVYNVELETWSVFYSAYGTMDFNCGANFINSDGKDITVMGGYNGIASVAWGDDEYNTGYLDGGPGGSVVSSELMTGMLNFGYPGIKRMRQMWVEAEIQSAKTFHLEVVGLSEDPVVNKDVTLDAREGARLSVDFILGSSRLGGSNVPTQAKFRASARSRAFQMKLTEQNTTAPHTLHSLTTLFTMRGNRFDS